MLKKFGVDCKSYRINMYEHWSVIIIEKFAQYVPTINYILVSCKSK